MSIENKVPMSHFTEVTEIADTARIIGLQDNDNARFPLQSIIAKIIEVLNARFIHNSEINKPYGVAGLNGNGKVPLERIEGIEIDTSLIPIDLFTPAPTSNGVFVPTEAGVYTNFGNLEVTADELENSLVYFYYIGGVFTKQVKASTSVDKVEPNNANAVSSQAVYNYAIQNVNTIADLRNLEGKIDQKINLLGYYNAGDKPSLIYEWIDDNTGVEDDGGSSIVVSSGYWKAVFSDVPSIRDFGAKGDNFQDDSMFVQNAINYVELKNDLKMLYVNPGNYRIKKTVNINKAGFILQGTGALMREESYKERTEPIVSRAKSFRGCAFIIESGIIGFRVTESATDHLYISRVQFTTTNENKAIKDTNAIYFNSSFSGPMWTINIIECHFRAFDFAVRVGSEINDYCIAFMNFERCSFSRNNEVLFFNDLISPTKEVTLNNIEGFRFINNKCHDNARSIRICAIADRIVIEDNNFEGNTPYSDGTYPNEIIYIESRSFVEFTGNHFEGTNLPNLRVNGYNYGDRELNFSKLFLRGNTYSIINEKSYPVLSMVELIDYDGYPYIIESVDLKYTANRQSSLIPLDNSVNILKSEYTKIINETTMESVDCDIITNKLVTKNGVQYNYISKRNIISTLRMGEGNNLVVKENNGYVNFSFSFLSDFNSGQAFTTIIVACVITNNENLKRTERHSFRTLVCRGSGEYNVCINKKIDFLKENDKEVSFYIETPLHVNLRSNDKYVFVSKKILISHSDKPQVLRHSDSWDIINSGTLNKGDVVLNNNLLKTITEEGTLNVISKNVVSIDGNKITLNNTADIYIGDYVTDGVKMFKVTAINGSEVYLNSNGFLGDNFKNKLPLYSN